MVQSHGASSVVSMLDHYFSTHSLKESVRYCHAGNCVGQNKNRFVIGYFAWFSTNCVGQNKNRFVIGYFA